MGSPGRATTVATTVALFLMIATTVAHAATAPQITSPAEGATVRSPVPIDGTAEAQALVRVYEGTNVIATATAGTNRAWSTLGTFTDGWHTIKATATDGGGTESAFSGGVTFRVDTIAPDPPAISKPDEGTKHGKVVTVSGTATGDSKTVSVKDAATSAVLSSCTPSCAVVPVTNSAWSTQVTFAGTGDRRIYATAKDEAVNESRPSNVRTFSADAEAPTKPVVQRPGTGPASSTSPTCTESNWDRDICTIGPRYTITGTFTSPPADGANVTVTVKETLPDNSEVVLGVTRAYSEPPPPGSTTGAIRWALRPAQPFTEGKHTIYAIATDDFGNGSVKSDNCVFRVDAAPPPPPAIHSPGQGAKLKSSWVNLYGTAEPNSTVTVREGNTTVALTLTSPYGDWSVARTFADGEHTITATATDKYGNESADSTPVRFTLDGTAPSPPFITAPAEDSTVAPPVTIAGTAEPGSTVTLREGEAVIGTATADVTDGSWSISVDLDNGPHTIAATATDASGHQGEPSTVSFRVDPDTEAPAPPEITSPVAGSVYGPSVIVSGMAEAGSTVEVAEVTEGGTEGGTQSVGTATADENGDWTLGSVTFATGEHTLRAVATDTAGNDSLPSDALAFTVDTDVPAVRITAPADNAVFQPGSPVTVSGTVSDNVAVQGVVVIFTDAAGNATTVPAPYTPGAEAGTGTWSATTGTLPFGRYKVEARATDSVGNIGTSTPVNIVVLSTTMPSSLPVPSPMAVPTTGPPPAVHPG